MTVTVPTSDVVNNELQGRITVLGAQITAAGNNGPLVLKLTKEKANMQMQLVLSLLGSGRILASNVLANETYTTGQPGGDQY